MVLCFPSVLAAQVPNTDDESWDDGDTPILTPYEQPAPGRATLLDSLAAAALQIPIFEGIAPEFPPQSDQPLPEGHYLQTLPNGQQILYVQDTTVPMLTVGALFRWPGILTEPELVGLPHLLPYLYKNRKTPPRELPGKRPTDMDVFEPVWQFETTTDYSLLFASARSEFVPVLLPQLARELRTPAFDSLTVMYALRDLASTLQISEFNPLYNLETELLEQYYGDSPYRLQLEPDYFRLRNTGPGRLAQLYERFNRPQNRLIFLCGDFRWQVVAPLVLQHFLYRDTVQVQEPPLFLVPVGSVDSLFLLENERTPQPVTLVRWTLPPISPVPKLFYTARVVASLLGLPGSGLHDYLRQQGHILDYQVQFSTDAFTSALELRAYPQSEKIEVALSALQQAFQPRGQHPPYFTPAELAAAQIRALGDFEFRLYPRTYLPSVFAAYWARGNLDAYAQYRQGIEDVTLADVYGFLRSFILDQPALCGTLITSYHTLVSDVEEYVNAQQRWTLPPLGPSPQELAQRQADSLRAIAEAEAEAAQILDTLDVTRFRIYFQTSTFLVDSTALGVMETLRSYLEHHPDMRLYVDGHSDTQGPAWYNLQLARQRAETVRTLLIENYGIDAARLQVRSFGESKPESSEDTPENTARNRRVQFTPR